MKYRIFSISSFLFQPYQSDLCQSRLKFLVDVPIDLIPDSYFTSKLFEHLEVQVNHVSCTSKSTDSDYPYTDYFTSRLNYTKGHIETIGSLQGIWGIEHVNALRLNSAAFEDEVAKRRRDCEVKIVDGKRFMRYSFIIRLNSGVIENHPLPKSVPIKLIFYRADAEKALLSMNLSGDNLSSQSTYDLDRSIRLVNPLLELVNTQSAELDKKYSQHRLPDLELPFLDKQIR